MSADAFRAELGRLLDVRAAAADWDDVLRRAGESPSLRRRRIVLALVAAIVIVLVTGSALALSGRFGGLLRGTPVRDLTPLERFFLEDLPGKAGRVELVGRHGDRAFYVLRRRAGGVCYAVGRLGARVTPAQADRETRFGALGCVPRTLFPSRLVPVLDFSVYAGRFGRPPHLVRLEGFAADPARRVGVIGPGNRVFFSAAVTGNTYSRGAPPGLLVRGIVAFDASGKPVYVQCFARRGCGRFHDTPRPNLPPARSIRPFRPKHPVSQHGRAAGARIDIRGVDVVVRLTAISPRLERLLAARVRNVDVGCFKLTRVAGRTFTAGNGVTRRLSDVVPASLASPGGRHVAAPFDGCTVTGMYGHRWNDAHGTHDAIEFPLTARGRRYFAERAAARDLAWLVRSRRFRDVRYHRGAASARELAAGLPGRLVPLGSASATPAAGRIGLWVGPAGRLLVVDRASTGRRLWIELHGSRVWRTNVSGLAGVL